MAELSPWSTGYGYPITRTPTSASPPRAGPRSFWQASTSAQNRSAWPRLVRSASKLTLSTAPALDAVELGDDLAVAG